MNDHANIQKLLSAYCSHDLSEFDRRMVERHLAECTLCRVHLTDLKTTVQLLRTTPEVEPPPWLTSRIMAHLREEKAGKRSWLQWIWFPQHTTFPVKILALLVVCVSGYYLSRSVETELKQTAQLKRQEIPAQPAPVPTVPPAALPAGHDRQEQPSVAPVPSVPQPAGQLKDLTPPVLPQIQTAPAPGNYSPPPPANTDRYGGKSESLKTAPAAESSKRIQDAAPEMKTKNSRSAERHSDITAPAGRAAGAPEAPVLPQAVIRLSVVDPSTAPARIREAVLRSGGNITDEQDYSGPRLTARIPAERQNELLERLQRLGRITGRPANPPAGIQLLELTIQW